MPLAILFSLAVISAGYGVLRGLGLAKGAAGLGLAPGAGLASLAVASAWPTSLGVPPPLAGLIGLALAGLGCILAIHDRLAIRAAATSLARQQRLAAALLLAALTVPSVVTATAFAGIEVPLSPHDGAAHTELIHGFRSGRPPSASWYPPGLTTLFAAVLQLVPWIDSARGAFELGLSLPILAALAVFGLGAAVWRDLRIASSGALLLGITYLYPYFPQLWSGWPLAASLILVVSAWTLGLEYLARPSARWAVLAGLLLGAIVLIHGSELYTLAVVLLAVLVGAGRSITWRRLPADVGLAVLAGGTCAAVYLPTLVQWAGAGGAYQAGLEDASLPGASSAAGARTGLGPESLGVFALGALGIDLPVRMTLLAGGIAWAFIAGRGRSVVSIGAAFAALAVMFGLLSGGGPVRELYAVLFPWGMHYRLLMVVALAQVLLASAGAAAGLRIVGRLATGPGVCRRQLRRLVPVGVVTWLVLVTWATCVFMMYPARLVVGYSAAEDAAAMAWLRSHVDPGELVINDGYADAGIWAPYKAGVAILQPRWGLSPDDLRNRAQIIENITRLDQLAPARTMACALNTRYVYYGAKTSEWDVRRLPPVEVLRRAPTLELVFEQGEARIFRVRLSCP